MLIEEGPLRGPVKTALPGYINIPEHDERTLSSAAAMHHTTTTVRPSPAAAAPPAPAAAGADAPAPAPSYEAASGADVCLICGGASNRNLLMCGAALPFSHGLCHLPSTNAA